MFFKHLSLLSLLFCLAAPDESSRSFIYNGFHSQSNLSLDGIAGITPNGLLKLTNDTRQKQGHAFYPNPLTFKNSSSNGTAFTFSTTFVFAIVPQYPTRGGHGIAFVIAPTRGLPGALPSRYLGLFNGTNNGNDTNHVLAIELDTVLTSEFDDIDGNHVGIDINGLRSEISKSAAYYYGINNSFNNFTLTSGEAIQVWVDYDGVKKQINVTICPIHVTKPSIPLLTLSRDLSPVLKDTMFVGFSSSTGTRSASHYVMGWSFTLNGQAKALTMSNLPKLPRLGPKKKSDVLIVRLPAISVASVLVIGSILVYLIRRKRKYAEVVEDWELDYGPQRFKYKDLYQATKGFSENELLGSGGFGRVYKGVLPTSKNEIAVKMVSHGSRQGMKEFVAEIVSIGRLRHRNIVPLLGYCRRKGELLLVYDYMHKGSLDNYLHDQPKVTLNWSQRFKVMKGVASGLLYLHEGWEQVVIHRDVKASNVLLDFELNGRLGDFGLARLYDHGKDPQTTHIVGTLGYLAPEHTRTGKATTSTDVFAFGVFLLEVACGRRPIYRTPTEDVIMLVDWVYSHWSSGEILQAMDPNLNAEYVPGEMELVLKLGLLCSHPLPSARPSMRQVVQFLEKDVPLPDFTSLDLSVSGLHTFAHPEGLASSVVESLLSGGR